MVFREFDKVARYNRRKIEIPYTIIFYNSGPGKPETSAGVFIQWNEITLKGEYCKAFRDLSNKQLNELGLQTHYSFIPKGSNLKHKKSSARQFIYGRLREFIYRPKIRNLIGD